MAFQGEGYRITIDRNRIYHQGDFAQTGEPHAHALYITGQEYIVSNNVIYDTVHSGIQIAGRSPDLTKFPSNNFCGFSGLIANNTIAYSIQSPAVVIWNAGANGTGSPAVTSLMQGILVKNNLFFQNTQGAVGTATASAITLTLVSPDQALGVVIANNIHYANGTRRTNFITPYVNAGAAYVLSEGIGGNCPVTAGTSCATNPDMTSTALTLPVNPNFRLTTESNARAFGANLTADFATYGVPAVDFDGVARPSSGNWDVGAYQFAATVP
jgi:hypothetical protein